MSTPLYGLDIETDTSAGGLDPARAGVMAVALSTPDGETVFTGEEAGLLVSLDRHLACLDPGVVVTWNGAAFDLPFLAERAQRRSVRLGLTLMWDVSTPAPHEPLPGHPGRYRGVWHGHRHLDAYRAYRAFTPPTLPCGLKATARREGLVAVEQDAAAVHLLGLDDMRRYVASDASVTRLLAQSRWAEVRGHVDPLQPQCTPALFHMAAG